ncbi:hypothetical protein PMY38_13690 [Clostridium tertium]|jgi:hypothetical protein|uniref:hypothetical protein n=1 Tax=Clostridium tertium TaxID=1559 RepID=UPI001379810F|nr:hypothetical protein [Clostridium tertium]MDU8967709.1 hypothetical protein [Clostridium sp.]MBU6137387.1 hypothetical protein [Clostridium tertium]MDB1939186.1 hypothetical protein [Clostridium tertium]MDB1956355.1 hypothetical protein [Clostridium tertium]MDB1959651.1 hypothetical protein [Clostridium tertium]
MSTQEMLEEAVKHFGTSDIITKMLSQRRDKEILEEQKKLYKAYKEDFNNGRICPSFN